MVRDWRELTSLPAADWTPQEAAAERERCFGSTSPLSVYAPTVPAPQQPPEPPRPVDYATVWHGVQEPPLEPSPPLVQRLEERAGRRRWRPW